MSELSFGAGEALTLLLGAQAPEGWWLGCRCDGAAGLVPQTYVQPRPELPTVGVPAREANCRDRRRLSDLADRLCAGGVADRDRVLRAGGKRSPARRG